MVIFAHFVGSDLYILLLIVHCISVWYMKCIKFMFEILCMLAQNGNDQNESVSSPPLNKERTFLFNMASIEDTSYQKFHHV